MQFANESTLPQHVGSEISAPQGTPSWTIATGTEFRVRCGPNYAKNGKKECSLESLYEVYSVRYFRSDRRTESAANIMPLPGATDATAGAGGGAAEGHGRTDGVGATGETAADRFPELDGTEIPDVLIVHFYLPYESPNAFKRSDDGPGGECVYYLRPSRRFLDEISGRSSTTMTPASALFAKWCMLCRHDERMRGRFKCMALVRDIERHNFGLLKTYNGKPVLITDSGSVIGGRHGDVRFLELTVNGESGVLYM